MSVVLVCVYVCLCVCVCVEKGGREEETMGWS